MRGWASLGVPLAAAKRRAADGLGVGVVGAERRGEDCQAAAAAAKVSSVADSSVTIVCTGCSSKSVAKPTASLSIADGHQEPVNVLLEGDEDENRAILARRSIVEVV